ncbi:MAG: hypothetical protein Q9209_004177 [Squamulea sp. 1 TL-2023]
MATRNALVASSHCLNLRSAITKVPAILICSPLWASHGVNRVGYKNSDYRRRFSRASQPQSELVSWKASTGVLEGIGKAPVIEANVEKSDDAQPLPWYLQIQTPRQEPKSASERQRLPNLPNEPPPLLQPMLEHISIDLGLDDLSLLDLRDLDPPPALGANLLMVIGTARSEKHLHVSADRFCRWLRTAHKLKPYADGLLGRGELRLKLKRKNRRTRMLNSVGASDSSNTDDGIRTGWVCVNVGMIEDGRSMPPKDGDTRDDGYVGFGGENSGVKVVIQMLTEEKREELDLETLWNQALARYTRRRDRIAKGQEERVGTSDHLGLPPENTTSSSTQSLIL